jgi:hypothetical protein
MAQFASHRPEFSHNDFSAPTYANSLNIFWSQWDFLFQFHHNFIIMPDESDPAFARDAVSRVVISPQHAKALLNVMIEQVAKYEEKYGEIVLVSEVPTE